MEALTRWEQSHDTSLVLIGGPTAGGKSTLAERLRTPDSLLISLDRYYLEPAVLQARDGQINFSVPKALDELRILQDFRILTGLKAGETFTVPVFDMQQGKRIGEENLKVSKRIIVEGIYVLSQVLADTPFKIFVDASTAEILGRKLARDTQERGIPAELVIERFEKYVKPAIEEFVNYDKLKANIVIENHDNH